jgi:hypothetical protein
LATVVALSASRGAPWLPELPAARGLTLDEEERKLIGLMRRLSPPLSREVVEGLGPTDPRWVRVIEAALADRKLAVVGNWFIALGGRDIGGPWRKNLSEEQYGRIEARARVLEMVGCWRGGGRDQPPAGTGVDLRMKVGADGIVKEAFFMRFEPAKPEVERCMIQVAKRWFFWPSFRVVKMRVRLGF